MCTRVWFPPCHLFINRLIVFFLSFWEAPLIDQWGMGKERGVILSRVILVTTSGYMKEEMWHTCSFWKPGWACLNTHTKSTFMSPYRPGRRGRQWPVFPGTKCSLCPPELPRFNGGDCPCSVQRVLRCAWLITVLNAGAGRPPGGERAGRPTWNPGGWGAAGTALGQHPSAANKRVEKSPHPSHMVYIKAEVRCSHKQKSNILWPKCFWRGGRKNMRSPKLHLYIKIISNNGLLGDCPSSPLDHANKLAYCCNVIYPENSI